MTATNPIPPRLQWACRRGMLELDLWLGRFLNESWPDLDQSEKALFETLLEAPDPTLYRWLTQQETPSDPATCKLIDRIRDHARS